MESYWICKPHLMTDPMESNRWTTQYEFNCNVGGLILLSIGNFIIWFFSLVNYVYVHYIYYIYFLIYIIYNNKFGVF